MRGYLALVVGLVGFVSTASAQSSERVLQGAVIEPFHDVGFVGEMLAVRGPTGTHPAVAGGFHLGGGLDTGPWMIGVALEGYALAPAHGVGGGAATVEITNAFHVLRNRHIDALFTVGYSGYALDSLPRREGAINASVRGGGTLLRAGVSKEIVFAPLGFIVYSAELEMRPQASELSILSPSLRIGLTYRGRSWQAIGVPRSRPSRAVSGSAADVRNASRLTL